MKSASIHSEEYNCTGSYSISIDNKDPSLQQGNPLFCDITGSEIPLQWMQLKINLELAEIEKRRYQPSLYSFTLDCTFW